MAKVMMKHLMNVVLVLCLGIGFWSTGLWIEGLNLSAMALTEQQQLVMDVWRIVNRSYLDETFNHQNWWFVRQRALRQPLETWEAAYDSAQDMLTGLDDPYTRFLPPTQYQSLQTSTSGELLGVGLQIAQSEDLTHLMVIAPIEGSPAEDAGLQPKDEIIEINGSTTLGVSLDEAAARLRGPAGTIVTLKIVREQVAPFEINLKRDRINLNPVMAEVRTLPEGTFGYLRLGQFNGNAVSELTSALKTMEVEGVDAYILDLRNNPGGLLQAGIEIARLWLDQGTIVYTVNRQGVLDSFEANGRSLTADPLVVLVNEGTASASEILAGALQDTGRAKLVGEKTFGKGLIQSLFDLSHGAGLAVTVAKYETPNHRDINRLGITPDQTVAVDVPLSRTQFGADADGQYQAAVDVLLNSMALASATS